MKLLVLFVVLFFSASSVLSEDDIRARIIGGSKSSNDQFPFAAHLVSTTRLGKYSCVGSLISEQWILTAAQCVDQASNVEIHLGSNLLRSPDANRVALNSGSYIKHPAYNHATLENDIAVIRLPRKVYANAHIHPISFFQIGQLADYAKVSTIGWGATSDANKTAPDALQYVNTTTIALNECQEHYGNQIKSSMICTNGALDKGTCEGDMGAPLLVYVRNTYNYIAGVASFISGGGCQQRFPSGFTRVANFTTWISSVTDIHPVPLYDLE